MIGAFSAQQITRPQQQTAKVFRYPAPLKGIDSRISIAEGSLENCVYTYNMVPAEFGMVVRRGYREWQTDIETTTGLGVHTVIPFDSVTQDPAKQRLFSVTNEGIWDTTVLAAVPVLVQAFTETSADAGYGVYTHYVGNNEDDVLFYADSLNGIYQYDATADTWARPVGITGPVLANVNFVVAHKQRLWLIEENSSKAWYLAPGAISGAATEFFFGPKFRHGGNLVGLFNWSVDGGAGVDDYLVSVSQSGDVLPYQGDDPATTAWTLVGTYFIGQVPKGPNIGSEHGGELYLMSSYGLVSVSNLLKGLETVATGASSDSNGIATKISQFIRTQMKRTITDYGWSVRVVPSEGGILISSPIEEGREPIQYFYNIATAAWGMWRGLHINAFDTWNNNVVIGLDDNRVGYMDVDVDDVKFTPPEEGGNGVPIEWSILSGFNSLESPALYKQVKLVRPDFLSIYEPEYVVRARYDYELTEAGLFTPTFFDDPGLWDAGLWGSALWGSDANSNFTALQGAWGTGRYVAIVMKGRSRAITRFVGWDVLYTAGGPLV